MQSFIDSSGGSILRGLVSYIPIIGGIITTLLGFFGGGPDLSKITKAINDLANQTGQALDALKRFSWSIGRLALGALLLLYHVINDMIGELVNAFRSLLKALKTLYEDVIKPALKAIRKIRGLLDDVYRRWLRPVINAIQLIRRILAIFRIFGFKWAAALDARLARIEGRIIGPFLWLLRQFNAYTGWINVILTRAGVFQKPIFRNSLYANAGWLANLFWTSQTAGGLAGARLADEPAEASLTVPQVAAQFEQYARTDTGPLASAAQDALAAAQRATIGA